MQLLNMTCINSGIILEEDELTLMHSPFLPAHPEHDYNMTNAALVEISSSSCR